MNKLVVPIVLIALGLVALLVMGLVEGGIPEIQAREIAGGAYRDRFVKVHGLLDRIDHGERPLRFTIRDKETPGLSFPVYADKMRPDTFQESFDVSVEGRWDAERGAFVADRILTKCPSKYEDEAKEGIGSEAEYKRRKGTPEKAPAAPQESVR